MMTNSTRIKIDNLRKYNGLWICRFDYEKWRVGEENSYPSWTTLKKYGMLRYMCTSYCYRNGKKVTFNSYKLNIRL